MIKKVIQFLLDFLFPKNCLICQEHGSYLCQKCFKNLKFKDPHCPSCDKANTIGKFCSKCQKNFSFNGVLVAGDFKDTNLAKLIKSYKYNFIKELGIPLGFFLINFLNNNIKPNPLLNTKGSDLNLNIEDYLLIPVPLSKKRLKWRGFNQSQILTEVISKELNLNISLDLIRTKHKTAQAKLNKQARQNNLKNCFKWTGESLENKNIIIVDDVYTTGSTLNEIAQELKKQQAGEIWGLVLAKG